MSGTGHLWRELGWRSLMALPFFTLGILNFGDSICSNNPLGGAITVVFFMAGAVVLARPISAILAEPWGRLYYSQAKFDRPQPIYSIPETHRARGRYKEAIAGLEAIAQEHPDEVRPHLMMIDIAVKNLKSAALARSYYKRGLAALTKPESKAELERKFAAQEPWLLRLEDR